MQEKLFPSSVHVQSCDVQVHNEKKPSLPMAIYHNTFPNTHSNKESGKERDEIREWINLNEIQSSDNIMTLQTTTTTAIITTGICMI